MRADIKTGATLPDYELPDHLGRRRRLSDLQGSDPMVLVLARGMFCPKDHRQHLNLVRMWPEFRLAYTKLVTVSTDGAMETYEFREQVGATWPFLSDPERVIQKDLDIAEYTDPTHDPMVPHTFVLAPGLKVHAVYNGYWFWGRPSNEDLRRDLREVTRTCRPDWDLARDGLREGWDSGDRSDFFPYGRSFADLISEQGDPASEY